MSFLNPVNEPVLRFSSTDADAPQINYNARVAGDVKAVLKACLVTGYGAKAGAGWSIVNEVDHVAEFVSPSVVMSDYRLGIDDTSAANIVWSYTYQDSKIIPIDGNHFKSNGYVDKTSANNGWELLVSSRGFYLVEILQSTLVAGTVATVVFFGQPKSAMTASGANMVFFAVGHNGSSHLTSDFFTGKFKHINIGGSKSPISYFGAVDTVVSNKTPVFGISHVDIASPLYMLDADKVFLGEQVGWLSVTPAKKSDLYGNKDSAIDGRPVLKVCLGANTSTATELVKRASVVLLRLDQWEY